MTRPGLPRRVWQGLTVQLAVAGCLLSGNALATPPEYTTYDRNQETSPEIREQDLLRIWIIYVGQGDAILIQLPERFSYTVAGRKELVDILVDGGPSGQQLRVFLNAVYPKGARIEHVVLTHHDTDHVQGLTALLGDDNFAVERVYHNGLASWGQRTLPSGQWPSAAEGVFDKANGRVLGLLDGQGPEFQSRFLVRDLAALKKATSNSDMMVGVYADFATAVTQKAKPVRVAAFDRVFTDSSFIKAQPSTPAGPVFRLEPLWPRERPKRYGDWGYSINGNSVTFRLQYGKFSMLFTGDHNEESEKDLLTTLKTRIRSEVLKVPHHGSQHNAKEFFDSVSPVISIASMGGKGFGTKWKHPSPDVIKWAGGAHRIFHTHIHERVFDYDKLNAKAQAAMAEKTHVLVETDGRWFRVVETNDPRKIPSVLQVRRGNGTRWIDAKE